MNSEYASQYRRLYEQHWWWRAREKAVLRVLQRRRPAIFPGRILDVGCGDALLFDKLGQWGEVEGVEIEPSLVSPHNPWRRRIHIGPFDESFRPNRSFSLILMLDVLEHLSDPLAALRRARDLLVPGGKLLVHAPALRALWTNHDVLNHHTTRFSKRSLRRLFAEASFRLEDMKYCFHWTCPIKLAIRARESVRPTAPAPPRIPPPPINRFCYGVCRLEQRLFPRVTPPFGSSLMAVAAP